MTTPDPFSPAGRFAERQRDAAEKIARLASQYGSGTDSFRATYLRETPAGKWRSRLGRLGLVALGVGAMALEGSRQPSPGIGLAFGGACLVLAVLLGSDWTRDHG